MAAATTDRRRRMVTVTPKGQVLLRHAHPWQERIFAELTADWSDRRREEFRAAMADLIARSYELEGQLDGPVVQPRDRVGRPRTLTRAQPTKATRAQRTKARGACRPRPVGARVRVGARVSSTGSRWTC
jgi:hypothetical protein